MPTCSIIIPVHNAMPLTRQCLSTLFATMSNEVTTEIIVVDDNSTDLTAELLASYGDRIRTIHHTENTGFATACNDGAAIASGEFLVFLNNDTVPERGWLRALIQHAIDHPKAAVVGSKLLYPDNTIQHAGIVIREDRYPWHLYVGFPATHPAVNHARRFQAVTAASMLIRRTDFERVSGFDPAFRNGYEDVDLCFRLGEMGAEIHYCPQSVVYHLESATQGRNDTMASNVQLYDSRWKHRVVPDHLRYYVEDGLLNVRYRWQYPAAFEIAPELGTVDTDSHQHGMDMLIDARAAQVFSLMQENAELKGAIDNKNITTNDDPFASAARTKLRTFLTLQQSLSFPAQETPLMSIVMPVSNGAEYVYTALESILAHTGDIAYEVVIVDDASGDETPRLLQQVSNVHVVVNERPAGFGKACNQGAAKARGAYVCFLNSDTIVTPGWLDSLADVFERDSRCGAVGAKLVYANGRLQEAGSIIWRDGTTIGYGRGADPFTPEFCHLREVDYCSAACLAVRRDLFMALGGFDDRYSPAYYEDADLCMQIREAGYTVVYDPDAVVFHLEHKSSGRATAMELQARNRVLFVERWQETLAQSFGQDSLPEVQRRRDRRSGIRVLVIDDAVPSAHFGRGLPRTFALLQALADSGYVVTFLPAHDPTPHEPTTHNLRRNGIEVLHGVIDVSQMIRDRAGLYDVAIISRPHHATFIDVVRQSNPRAVIVYDAEAVFSVRDIQRAAVSGTPLPPDVIESRIRAELTPVSAADLIITVTESERRLVQRYHPHIPVTVWGHMVSHQPSPGNDPSTREGLLFVGYLGSEPNEDAALILVEEVLPAIAQEIPCHLEIVGLDATAKLQQAAARAHGAVTISGHIVDLLPVYESRRVFVAPHRWAAGIPLKVVEAMSFGIPCVVSDVIGGQLGVTDGCAALVATDASDFARKTVRLLRDDALWTSIQGNALRFVRDRFDPVSMRRSLRDAIDAAIVQGIAKQRRTSPTISLHDKPS